MTACALKQQLQSDMKSTMKSGDKSRLAVIRLILSAIKQVEVDERIELDDAQVIALIDKMLKQRRESIVQFEKGNRQDLIDIEQAEMVILQHYLPEALSEDEIDQLISDALGKTGASNIKHMGQVMGILKPQLQGRADMGKVSQLIKSKLGVN
jgi:uncharacterized protein YqeY